MKRLVASPPAFPIRAVYDTNIFISSVLFKGTIPARLIDWAREGRINLFWSPILRAELNKVLGSKFKLPLNESSLLIANLEDITTMVYPEPFLNWITVCPADNRVLECAVTGAADFLVTGDHHFNAAKKRAPFRIVSPREFYELVLRLGP